jgi:hypothetical protein
MTLASGSRLFQPNKQKPGAQKNPKGVIADDRDFDEDANNRKQRDHERGDKSPLHLLTDSQPTAELSRIVGLWPHRDAPLSCKTYAQRSSSMNQPTREQVKLVTFARGTEAIRPSAPAGEGPKFVGPIARSGAPSKFFENLVEPYNRGRRAARTVQIHGFLGLAFLALSTISTACLNSSASRSGSFGDRPSARFALIRSTIQMPIIC